MMICTQFRNEIYVKYSQLIQVIPQSISLLAIVTGDKEMRKYLLVFVTGYRYSYILYS
jgi:hypothetical protein